jgi:hypothetical protein
MKTLQNAPRDADKLQALLKARERKKETADKWLHENGLVGKHCIIDCWPI